MKHTLKIMLATLGILIYIWGFMIGTDIRRTTLTNQLPLFAVKSETSTYYGLGYHIDMTYNESNAKRTTVTVYLFDHTIVNLHEEVSGEE